MSEIAGCTHERRGVIKVSAGSGSVLIAMNTNDGRGQIGEVRLAPCLDCGVVLLAADDLERLRTDDIEYAYTDADQPTPLCGEPLPIAGGTCTFPKGHERSTDPLESMHGFYGGSVGVGCSHTEDCDDPETCKSFGCDVCEREVPRCHIGKVMAYGIETYACDECRGGSR